MTLNPGTLLRHAKQFDWGVGEVVSAKASDGVHDVVITFEAGGERRLKLKDLTLLVPLAEDELVDRAASHAAAEKAAQAERKARSKRMKATRLAPFAQLRRTGTVCVDAGDGTVAFNGENALVFADGDGAVVDELQLAQPFASARYLDVAADGSLAGWSLVDDCIVLAKRGEDRLKVWRHKERMWHPQVEAVAGVGAVVTIKDEIRVVRSVDLSTELVAFPLRGRRLAHNSVRWWNHHLLVGTDLENAKGGDPDSRWFHCVGGDGAVRFEGRGFLPCPVDDDHFVLFDYRGTRVLNRAGIVVASLALTLRGPDTLRDRLHPFARVDGGDLVFVFTNRVGGGLVRLVPGAWEAPRWEIALPPGLSALSSHPVGVGRLIAVACRTYEGDAREVIVVVDATDGAVLHQMDVRDEIWELVAAGDDAIAAITAKHTYAWSALSSEKPQPHLLAHRDNCLAMCSPKPGVIAALAGDFVSFYRVA